MDTQQNVYHESLLRRFLRRLAANRHVPGSGRGSAILRGAGDRRADHGGACLRRVMFITRVRFPSPPSASLPGLPG